MSAPHPCLEAVLAANQALPRHGLAVLTRGNVSAVDRAGGRVAIKPSGVPYDKLTAADLVVTDLEGKVIAGRLRPSSDLPTHLELYRAWPAIGAVVHTHSAHATMFAQACRELPCLGTTHADHFDGAVPVTDLPTAEEAGGDYTRNIGRLIVRCLARRQLDPLRMPAALVAAHGPFVWGRDAAEALANAVALEETARLAFGTLALAPRQAALPPHLLERHFRRKHGPGAEYGQGR